MAYQLLFCHGCKREYTLPPDTNLVYCPACAQDGWQEMLVDEMPTPVKQPAPAPLPEMASIAPLELDGGDLETIAQVLAEMHTAVKAIADDQPAGTADHLKKSQQAEHLLATYWKIQDEIDRRAAISAARLQRFAAGETDLNAKQGGRAA
ncbi:hypothetical protein [Oceanobacter mangrovi]|uniref:hypothetical protein n=1 Tax=Oceanobacter mangrovi TaxID=2862510 RepID=UPI001C8E88E0|nr:hypothetical protein [Oceanobacter mangrovi]